MKGQVKFRQVKSGLFQSDRSSWNYLGPKFFLAKNFLDPKMHLRMKFDSGVGPTCLDVRVGIELT